MLVVDEFAVFFKFFFPAVAILVILSSVDYVSKFPRFQGEYYALVLLSAMGMMFMASTGELISIYISLELTGISLYALATFLKDPKGSEAGLKYLLLGAVASAILLYGMALLFGLTGKTHLTEIMEIIKTSSLSPALLLAMVFLIAGLGFKIASVPFQMWVPDVYEGAPTPITAYLSVASKAAGFAVVLRLFYTALGAPPWLTLDWGMLFAVLSAITMTLGNIMALPQTNIKRLLGYSSIAHAGYIMMGLAVMGIAPEDIWGRSSVLFYFAAYGLTNLGAFIAIIAISGKLDSDLIDDYTGMARRSPALSLALALCLISLIGLPPTAGFIAKVYIFNAAIHHDLLWLVVIAVLNTVLSAYYYLRVVKVVYLGLPLSEERVPSSLPLRAALLICCFGVMLLGIIPASMLRIAESVVFILS
jgi:NADH-quinone oxidoreductase subunit N